jgi:hypothetical protein
MSSFRRAAAAALVCTLLTWTAATAAAPADKDKQLSTLRHSLGAAMGSALYHTHLFIGATVDGFKGKVFPAQQVQDALSASVKVTTSLIDDLGRVKKAAPPGDDVAQVDELIAIGKLIIEETRLLYAHIHDPTPATEQAFSERHLRARARLGKLLGI